MRPINPTAHLAAVAVSNAFPVTPPTRGTLWVEQHALRVFGLNSSTTPALAREYGSMLGVARICAYALVMVCCGDHHASQPKTCEALGISTPQASDGRAYMIGWPANTTNPAWRINQAVQQPQRGAEQRPIISHACESTTPANDSSGQEGSRTVSSPYESLTKPLNRKSDLPAGASHK